MRRPATRSPIRTLTVAMTSTVVCVIPLFLVGALAVGMQSELGFNATMLGLIVGVFRLNAAMTSRYFGRFTDRFGATAAVKLGLAVAAGTCVAIALLARSWQLLMLFMFIGGTGQALCQPAANRMLLHRIPRERQGIAFGIKQSAPPAASMLAGVSVPVIGLTLGWRWAFALVPLLAAVAFLLAGPRVVRNEEEKRARKQLGSSGLTTGRTAMLMLSFGLGTAASGAVPAFYVGAAVAAGTEVDVAGTLLALASAGAILVRLIAGVVCDRMVGRQMSLAGGLLAVGSAGLGLLASGRPAMMAVGVAIALGGTWGFNGVFWYALMRAFPDAPGATTGAIAPGGLVGGIVGPIVFGALVDGFDYRVAWIFSAVLSVAAGAAMVTSSRRLDA